VERKRDGADGRGGAYGPDAYRVGNSAIEASAPAPATVSPALRAINVDSISCATH